MKTYRAAAICQHCGICCRHNPGAAAPEDFGCDQGRMVRALASGSWVVDENRWGLFIRPSAKFDSVVMFMFGGMGPCVFLGRGGCTLRHRPAFCRSLEPGAAACVQHGTYRDLRDAWAPWQLALRRWREELKT